MKTKLHSLFILLFAFATANTSAQIPNSGFENWSSFGSYMNPNDWATTNSFSTSSFYPVTRDPSHYPASVGTYSIRLENNTALLPNYEARGVAKSQDTVVNSNPAFPIIGHPTSLTGYYKFAPLNGDTMTIKVDLFNGGGSVASGSFTTATSASIWTSFNIPISSYTTADSGYIVFRAYANGQASIPHGNSVLNVDNLNFDNLITVISEIEIGNKISIYPNPFSSTTTLQTDKVFKDATLTVYNSFGQTVAQIKNLSGQTATLSRDNLPSGLYFIRLTEENKIIAVDKLVVTD